MGMGMQAGGRRWEKGEGWGGWVSSHRHRGRKIQTQLWYVPGPLVRFWIRQSEWGWHSWAEEEAYEKLPVGVRDCVRAGCSAQLSSAHLISWWNVKEEKKTGSRAVLESKQPRESEWGAGAGWTMRATPIVVGHDAFCLQDRLSPPPFPSLSLSLSLLFSSSTLGIAPFSLLLEPLKLGGPPLLLHQPLFSSESACRTLNYF